MSLRIQAGNEYSDEAAVLIPNIQTSFVNKVSLLPVEVVPDYNRDGKIDDEDRGKVTKDNPFRWWVNDDKDSGEFDASGADTPKQSFSPNDTFFIHGMRDLVDFFPLYLDLDQTLESFPASEYRYRLVCEDVDGELRFTETDLDPEEAGDFLKKLNSSSGGGLDSAKALASKSLTPAGESGGYLTEEFLNKIKDEGKGVILMGSWTTIFKPLILRISKGDTTVADIEFPIKISNVEDMYRHVDMRTVPKERDDSPGNGTASSLVSRTEASDVEDAYPDKLTNGKYFVFVHGFNVNEKKARGWNAEIFKRLHQMGSRARFVGISWYGDAGVGGIDVSWMDWNMNYHKAVFNAFQTGDKLKDALKFTKNEDVTIAAHSLGNIVVSHAVAEGGFSPNRYFMVNAAVAAEAYDASRTGAQRLPMLEKEWKPYLEIPGGSLKVTSARWYQLFDEDDKRADLKWVDRFSKVLQKSYNFYSPGDDVVENPQEDSFAPSFWGIVYPYSDLRAGRGAWGNQEFSKGSRGAAASITMEPSQAGWGFNSKYKSNQPPYEIDAPDPATVLNYNDNDNYNYLRENPVFRGFLEEDLTGSTLGSAKAGEKLVRYHVLAGGIPALSFAAAANPIGGDSMEGRDFNMSADFRTDENQWPTEGHDGKSNKKWIHSDFYGVALSHVYKMYEKMIELGTLDDESEN